MRRSNTLLLSICLIACVLLAGCIEDPENQFPSLRYGLQNGIGQGSEEFQMFQGWFENELVWFIAWDSSNLKPTLRSRVALLDLGAGARDNQVGQGTLIEVNFATPSPVPKLLSAIDNGAPIVYYVTNYKQGPVFTSLPGDQTYSGLWREAFITWKRGALKRPITSALALPGPAEATIELRNVVVNWPIVATGPLGGPWFPAPPGQYRLEQVVDYNHYRKSVFLPTWGFFGRDSVHRTVLRCEVAIPDVSDPMLAALLQANYAPALADIPQADTQKLWILDWTQIPPSPPGQLPVMEHILRNLNIQGMPNANYAYSPVMQLVLLQRDTLPPYVIVNNPEFIKSQLPPLSDGLAVVNDDYRLNVLMIASWQESTRIPVFPD